MPSRTATAQDIAAMFGMRKGTIYVWAHRDHWRRTRDWPRRYSLADARKSYNRRNP